MNNVVVTGFDGVITKKNTFNEFVKFTKGRRKYSVGKILLSPLHLAANIGVCSKETLTEKEFSYFFRKTDYEQLKKMCEEYAAHIDKNVKEEKLEEIKTNGSSEENIYVVSDNINEIIKPWCDKHGIKILDSTKLELHKGCVTGKLKRDNRLKEKIDIIMRNAQTEGSMKLRVFGNSSKDQELLDIADNLLAC